MFGTKLRDRGSDRRAREGEGRSVAQRLPARACLLALSLLFPACDSSFSPIAEHDLQFSIFGYFDASADTQWIRLMPVRATTVTAPSSLEATVTLEHLGSGRIIELRDSLFRFSPANPDIGSEGQYLHNFWTDERIEPGAEYRFTAQRPGEPPSEALISIPEEYGFEVWFGPDVPGAQDMVRLEGLRHVAFVFVVTSFVNDCGPVVQRFPFDIGPPEADIRMIRVYRRIRYPDGCGAPRSVDYQLQVVASGAPWPEEGEYSPAGLGFPAEASNISNSVGFVGGVLTKTVPYEGCRLVNPADPSDHCRVRYNGSSATLRGVVLNTTCGGNPIEDASVELQEVKPDPQQTRKVRFTSTDSSGRFEIAGLDEGTRYALTVRKYELYDPFNRFREHGDTVQFAAGEEASYGVGMEALSCAP